MNRADLHIVLGDSPAGSLREACTQLGLGGEVHPVADELSHGPLHDGRARAAYFRTEIYGRFPDAGLPDDVFYDWSSMSRILENGLHDAIAIWHSDAISDAIFLRMACSRLRDFAGTILSINTSEGRAWHGVGINSPEQLAAHFEHRSAIDVDQRYALADQFAEIVARRDLLRIWQHGSIATANKDYYDSYVMSFISPEWLPAIRIIGLCLGHRLDENMMGDAFFEWRLQKLIDGGSVEADGDRTSMRTYRVRLSR